MLLFFPQPSVPFKYLFDILQSSLEGLLDEMLLRDSFWFKFCLVALQIYEEKRSPQENEISVLWTLIEMHGCSAKLEPSSHVGLLAGEGNRQRLVHLTKALRSSTSSNIPHSYRHCSLEPQHGFVKSNFFILCQI